MASRVARRYAERQAALFPGSSGMDGVRRPSARRARLSGKLQEDLSAVEAGEADAQTRGELSDWAVNTLRDWAREAGISRSDLNKAAHAEFQRISRGRLDLRGYLRARRTDSEHTMAREDREAMYAHYVTWKSARS